LANTGSGSAASFRIVNSSTSNDIGALRSFFYELIVRESATPTVALR
jgi:hypothetical protein